ncbi:hypothetical protein [Bacillus sp. REN3]|uniref:hypothetical protein n=1 Tax=Bacillus sp. REN3 TaxID=2802440 RepID=UPI001AEF2521|nr:hypothetical protein [Bacillus sp. REN3]
MYHQDRCISPPVGGENNINQPTQKEEEAFYTHCKSLNLPPKSIHAILNAVQSQNAIFFLTESIRHRETTMTIVVTESGNIKAATTVYSDVGNKVILRETKSEMLPLLLTK